MRCSKQNTLYLVIYISIQIYSLMNKYHVPVMIHYIAISISNPEILVVHIVGDNVGIPAFQILCYRKTSKVIPYSTQDLALDIGIGCCVESAKVECPFCN